MKIYLCAIGRCENNYVREWVQHYKELLFDKIIIYDNNYDGEEYFEDVISDYINTDFVKIINYRNKQVCQLEAYNDCYITYSNECDWICFFDMDEFLILHNNTNIHEYLKSKKFIKFDGIRFCWKNFDDNNLIKVENNNYNCKSRFTNEHHHIHCKSIFKTNNKFVDFSNRKISDAHGCYDTHIKMCDCNGNKCKNVNNNIGDLPIYGDAWLNHYRYKTIDEFIRFKLNRCYPDATPEYTKSKGFGIDTFFYCNQKTQEKLDFIHSLGISYKYKN